MPCSVTSSEMAGLGDNLGVPLRRQRYDAKVPGPGSLARRLPSDPQLAADRGPGRRIVASPGTDDLVVDHRVDMPCESSQTPQRRQLSVLAHRRPEVRCVFLAERLSRPRRIGFVRGKHAPDDAPQVDVQLTHGVAALYPAPHPSSLKLRFQTVEGSATGIAALPARRRRPRRGAAAAAPSRGGGCAGAPVSWPEAW
jgi:hypothetical protein